ncbi:MAG: hypothetical protein AAGU17_11050 [Anaerolineaceae bacterium]
MIDYTFYAWYSALKVGKTGLAVTVDVRDQSGAIVVADGAVTEYGGGLYRFIHSSPISSDFTAVFKTDVEDVDAKQIPALFSVQMARLDSSISGLISDLSAYPVVTLAMPVLGQDVSVYAGDTIIFELTNLGSLVGAKKVYFTAKSRKSDTDANSIVQIERTDGLKYLNAQVGTALNGSLEVLDAAVGRIKVKLEAVESIKVQEGTYYFDIKVIEDDDEASSRTQGEITFYYDITKAIA